MRRLEGRRALVTGGSRGLGAAIARRLAQEGCGVAVSGRRESEHARAVIETIEAQGGKAVLVTGDVGDAAEAARIVERAAGELDGLDILVNSAGIWRGGRLKDANLDDWHEIWRINIMGTMHVTRTALPYLEAASKSGAQASIVVMSSSVGFKGFPGDTAYATTKAGLVGFTRALAKEVARKGITVNALTPGYINVGVTDEVPQKGRDMMLERIPLGRPGTADEVAAAVAFLVSEGTYITGHTLDIDGSIEL